MRYQYLDILRGLCIFLMIVFHLNYSLVNIFGIETLNISSSFWYIIGRIAALGFMIIAGISYFLASKKYAASELQKKYLKYARVLGVMAISITLLTYIFIPEQLIFFGILHLFALSFLILPFITRTHTRAIFSLFIIMSIWYFGEKGVSSEYLFPLGLYSESFRSADYYPLIPYFGYVLGGYLLAILGERYNVLRFLAFERELVFPERILSYMGKRSLIIYLIHQPIIIGVIWLCIKYL